MEKIKVTNGVYWVGIPEVGLYVLCGSPADSVKHLIKRGLISTVECEGKTFETGPNAILLSDVAVQNGEFANLAEFPPFVLDITPPTGADVVSRTDKPLSVDLSRHARPGSDRVDGEGELCCGIGHPA